MLTEDEKKLLKEKEAEYEVHSIQRSKLKCVKDRGMPYLNPLVSPLAIHTRVSVVLMSLNKLPLIDCGATLREKAGSIEWTSYCAMKMDDYDISKAFFMKARGCPAPTGFCQKILATQINLLEEIKTRFYIDLSSDLLHNMRYSIYNNAEKSQNSYYLAKTYAHPAEDYDVNVARRSTNEFTKIVSMAKATYPQYMIGCADNKKSPLSFDKFQEHLTTCMIYLEGTNPADLPIQGDHRDGLFTYAKKFYPEIANDYVELCAKAIYFNVVPEIEFKAFQNPKCRVYYHLIMKAVAAYEEKRAENEPGTIVDIFGFNPSAENIYLGKRCLDSENFDYDYEAITDVDFNDLEMDDEFLSQKFVNNRVNKRQITGQNFQNAQPQQANSQPQNPRQLNMQQQNQPRVNQPQTNSFQNTSPGTN